MSKNRENWKKKTVLAWKENFLTELFYIVGIDKITQMNERLPSNQR